MYDFEKPTLTTRYYKAPHGRMVEIEMYNIDAEDVDFFEKNDIVVSIEEVGNSIIVYGCPRSDESEESEVIVFAGSRSCEETMKALRQACEKVFL